MKNYLRFLSPVLLIMAVLFGGGKIYADEVTYTVDSPTKVTASKTLTDVTVTYNSTYNTKWQLTQNKTMTLTISGFTGKISAFKLNQAATKTGKGNLNITVNGNNVVSKTYAAKELGTSSSVYNEQTYTLDAPIETTGDIVITLKATANSLYCKSFTIVYDGVVSGKTSTTLSFPTSLKQYTIGDNNGTVIIDDNAAVLKDKAGNTISDYTGKITYSVATDVNDLAMLGDDENSSAIMVNTEKEGTATVTASFTGDDKYNASTASYTIKVAKPQTIEDGVFDFTGDGTIDYGSNLKPSTSNDYITTSTTWTAGNVTMTTSKGNGNGIRWWSVTNDDNELRIYAKSKFAFSVPDGYIITSIDLGVYNNMTVDCGTLNNSTWTGASQVVTFTTTDTKKLKTITVKYVKEESLTTSAKGYATYAADYAVNYSELGLTAYTVTVDNENSTATAKVFTGVVPAGKAVLVKGDAAKTYTLTPATADADATFATDLQTSTTSVTADGTQYIFTSKSDTPAFVQATANTTIAAKKGYLVLTDEAAAKLSLSFGDEATGIKAVEAAASACQPLYNVAGQRVATGYKGIVIVNGKKYLNK